MVLKEKKFLKYLSPLIICFTYLFLYLPILILVLFSFNDSAISVKWTGFSWRWYQKLIHSPQIWESLNVSLIVAFSSTIISLIIGIIYVISCRWWMSGFLNNLFYLNILLPDMTLAIGVLSIFTFLNIPLGYASLIIGHSVMGLAFVVPIIRARYMEIDPVLAEASSDLGASYFQTFTKITLPSLTPALIASGLLIFTLSLDDFLISFFCSSPTVQTLSVYVYSMIKTWVDPTINAISAILVIVSSILVFLLSVFKVVDQVISND